jgi:hypothetical protein
MLKGYSHLHRGILGNHWSIDLPINFKLHLMGSKDDGDSHIEQEGDGQNHHATLQGGHPKQKQSKDDPDD